MPSKGLAASTLGMGVLASSSDESSICMGTTEALESDVYEEMDSAEGMAFPPVFRRTDCLVMVVRQTGKWVVMRAFGW